MRRFLFFVFAISLVACASRSGCDPDLDLGLDFSGGKDECTPAGGQCYAIFCPFDSTPSTLNCGFLAGCCMPGRSNGSSGGSSSGSSGPGPDPFDEGKCNGIACQPGCACVPSAAPGFCTAVCDCSPDAGGSSDGGLDADAGDAGAGDVDAAEPDSGDLDAGLDPDAGDADPDAGAGDAEAGTPTPAGPPAPCGLILCAARCQCLSQSLSVCECRSGACDP